MSNRSKRSKFEVMAQWMLGFSEDELAAMITVAKKIKVAKRRLHEAAKVADEFMAMLPAPKNIQKSLPGKMDSPIEYAPGHQY